MQNRKCHLPGKNKNGRFIKNLRWTKCQSAKKLLANNTTIPLINSKPNDKNYFQYKQATEI